jgi:opacity protein-like surface antigen
MAWVVTAHLDLGGFGLGSDFTLSSSMGVQYQMTRSMILDLKYKALWVDYENGSPATPGSFKYDTVTHGPIVGVIFTF